MIVLYVLLGIIALVLLIGVIRAIAMKQPAVKQTESVKPKVSNEEIAEKLSEMVKVETISYPGQGVEKKFEDMRNRLEELFPHIFGASEKIVLAGNGIMLRWPGKDSGKNPYVFMSHIDVVPVEGEWEREPFSGDIEDGKVFGRGTADTKGSLSVILAALDYMAKNGEVPGRDIYVLSTASEEVSGPDAPEALAYFKERNITLGLVIDEGGVILRNIIPGVDREFAAIGLSEKSMCNLEFIAKGAGGHASAPPMQTPLGRLGAFMHSVEKNPPFEYKINDTIKALVKTAAPYMSFPIRFVAANFWWLSPIAKNILKKQPDVRTLLGTTCSFTMASGSDARNVLPKEAKAIANLRVSHHEGLEKVMQKMEARAKQFDVEMRLVEKAEIKRISDMESEGYQNLTKAIKSVYPNAVPIPYIMMANTDARHFHEISDATLRFMPIELTNEERKHIHTTNEFVNTGSFGMGAEILMNLVKES